MTLARRVLGGAAAPPWTFDIAQTGGMWQGKSIAPGVIEGDYLYAGWIENGTGDVILSVWDLDTQLVVRTIVLHAAIEGCCGYPDLHSSPSLLVHSSGYLWVMYSEHGGEHPLWCISNDTLTSDPTLASGMAAEVDLPGTAGAHTYMNLVQTAYGWTYCFARNIVSGVGRIVWWFHDGDDWNVPAESVMVIGVDEVSPYFRCVGDGGSIIHFFVSDTDRSDSTPSQLGHFQIQFTDQNFDGLYEADGTLIAAYASMPIDVGDVPVIFDDSEGPCDPEDAIVDGDGYPVALFGIYASSDVRHRVIRWTGSAWTFRSAVASGGLNGGNRYQVGGCFELANADRILVPRVISGTMQLTRQTWGGSAYTERVLTYGSVASFTPQAVANADNRCTAIFARGVYVDDDDFTTSVRGVRAV